MKMNNTFQPKMRFALGLSLAVIFFSFFTSCSTNKSMAVHFKKYPNRDAPSESLKEKKASISRRKRKKPKEGSGQKNATVLIMTCSKTQRLD